MLHFEDASNAARIQGELKMFIFSQFIDYSFLYLTKLIALTGNVTNCTPGQIRSRCQCDCEMAWFGTFPFCSGECPLGYIEMKRDKKPEGLWYQCLTGTKALCKTCKGATTPGGQTNNITSQIPGNISNRNTTQLDKNANSRNISQSGFFN